MVAQQSKKSYLIEPYDGVKIRWGNRALIDKYAWKEYLHSYAHNGEILFVDSSNKNLQCDFEIENNANNISFLAQKLKINRIKEFYKIWVVAETIAKIKNTPILHIIKSNVVEKLKAANEDEITLEDVKIKYFRFNKYHFAIGYDKKS